MCTRYRSFLALAVALFAAPAFAQDAQVQVIHNSPDPAAAVVDIYINGVNTLDDVAFRDATGFLALPSGVPVDVGIAPGTSTGPGDILATFTYTLAAGELYQLIATGVLDPSQFASNPDGESTAFTLLVNTPAQDASTNPAEVQFNVVHGSPDAPTVDVDAVGVGSLVDDAPFTAITGYLGVPGDDYTLAIRTADGNTTVASFTAPLTGAEGASLTVLASGFLDPSANQNGPAFGLLAVFADGSTLLLPTTPSSARVQVIHNSPDPAAAVVDIYIDDDLALDDVAFRTGTGYLDFPSGVEFTVGIAPGNSTSSSDALATFDYTLDAGANYQLIATGVLDPSQFAANPDGESTAFQLLVNTPAQVASTDPDQVQFNVVHGSPDAPTVDVEAVGVATLVDDASFTAITPYIGVPADDYTLAVKTADGSTTVAFFSAPLSGTEKQALTVLASGFLDPTTNQNGPAFGLLAVFADGTSLLLPMTTNNEQGAGALPDGFQLQGNYPNPFNPTTTLSFDLPVSADVSVAVFDVLGRQVLQTPPAVFQAGTSQTLRLDASALASGSYVYRVTAQAGTESTSQTGRFTLLK